MIPRSVIRSKAYVDLLEIFDYLSERSPTTAVRFRAACLDLADILIDMPNRGPVDPSSPSGQLRRVIVPGFGNYLLFYYVFSDQIVVARIMHSSRDIGTHLEESGDA